MCLLKFQNVDLITTRGQNIGISTNDKEVNNTGL